MDLTAFGLWLVGLGASVAAIIEIRAPAPPTSGGLTFHSPASAKPVRARQAVQTIALAFVAAGSAIVALAQHPSWEVAPGSTVAFTVGVWLLGAWLQRRTWIARRADYRRRGSDDPAASDFSKWRGRVATYCSRWSWALLHPFNGEEWPKNFTRNDPRPPERQA